MITHHLSIRYAATMTQSASPAHSLTDVLPGETVRVDAVPPALHDMLAEFGLRVGARVECESAARYLVVRTPSGSVPLERGLAAAVRVGTLDNAGGPGAR